MSNLIDHQAIEITAATWLARQDNARAWTGADEQALHAWLDQHVAHRVAWLRLKSSWVRADALRAAPTRRPGWRGRWAALATAASVVAVLCIAVVVQPGASGQERFATAVGARQGVTLADGSRVMLNTHTSARAVITGNERSFWLDQGEAFFDIQRDPGRPFVLVTGSDRITVLGTKFSVRHEGDVTRVTVLEGRVKFEAGGAGKPLAKPETATILVANHSAIANAGGVLVGVKTAQETQRELSWRAGWLEFENRPLRDIAAEFNRYNRRQLVVDSDVTLLLAGRFDMYNVDGFVRSIEAGFGVVAYAEGDRIRLSMK